MKPKVSVIIPVYNGEDFVAATVESVLNQTHAAHEIITVDDGSSDRSAKILSGYGSKIRYVRLPVNAGISVARNTAMHLASGDLVTFVDQDDLWFRNKLEKQVEASLKFPTAGIFCSDFITRLNKRSKLIRHFPRLKTRSLMRMDRVAANALELLLHEHFVGAPSTVMIRKDLVDQVGDFDSRYLYVQDYDYFLRCVIAADMVILSDTLVFKRAHDGNFSSNLAAMYAEELLMLENAGAYLAPYMDKYHLQALYRSRLADVSYMLGDVCFENGHAKKAFDHYFRAFKNDRSIPGLVSLGMHASKKFVRLLLGSRSFSMPQGFRESKKA